MNAKRTERLPIVGVIGSGREPHEERAGPLGRWLAEQGVHLLTGGGGGVMESVSRAFYAVRPRRGIVIGIVPGAESEGASRTGRPDPATGYPNRYVEIPIFTHLPMRGTRGTDPMSRNHVNVLTADLLVALPGSAGTASETALAVGYGTPIVAFIDCRDDIVGLPPEVPIESNFARIQAFVLGALEKV